MHVEESSSLLNASIPHSVTVFLMVFKSQCEGKMGSGKMGSSLRLAVDNYLSTAKRRPRYRQEKL